MSDSSLTQAVIAEHLDMSVRNAANVLSALSIDWKSSTLDQIRVAYIRDLREKAAGRGGDDAHNLARQRAQESAVKTAMLRLEYNQRIKELVPAEDAAMAITEWCSTANREYRTGLDKLISEIGNQCKVDVPTELVESIVNPTVERIQSHARSIGRNLVERGGDVHATEETGDSGMDLE